MSGVDLIFLTHLPLKEDFRFIFSKWKNFSEFQNSKDSKINSIKQGYFASTYLSCYSYCFFKNGAMIFSIFILLSLVKSRMNVIKYTIRGERIKVKGFKKKTIHMALMCTGATLFVCFQLPFVTYNGQLSSTTRYFIAC